MTQSRQTHRPPLRQVMETYVAVTGSTYSAKAGDQVIGVNFAGTVTVTLPTAQLRPGRIYTVKDESGAAGSNNITVATEGPETIDGSATDLVSTNYGAKAYYSDGSNWFTVPLLAAPSVAHSSTTGQGTDDHHAQAHTADHNSGGADALKLDDLATPDDNTDLDFSTSAHGLVPKGTNTGDFLKDDGSWAAPAGGGSVTREGGQTTEATSTSTSAVDLLTAASLTIATTDPFEMVGVQRKTSGAAAYVGWGLKLNTTVTGEASSSAGHRLNTSSNTDQAENRYAHVESGVRITNYDNAVQTFGSAASNTGQSAGGLVNNSASMPIATITDLIVRYVGASSSVTGAADETHVYTRSTS